MQNKYVDERLLPPHVSKITPIVVQIEKHCMDKMQGWCNAAKTEVSGWGKVQLVDGIFKVSNVWLPQQKCSTGYTLIEAESTARLKQHLYEKCKTLDEMVAFWDDIKFWWHTHYDFNTFWSDTDDNQAKEVAKVNGEWSLSLVINQKGDRLCRTDFMRPVPVTIDNLTVMEVNNTARHAKRDYDRDIKRWVGPLDKVVFKPKKSYVWNNGGVHIAHSPAKQSQFISYGGKVMSMEQYALALVCPCGDGTCIDCGSSLKERYNVESY